VNYKVIYVVDNDLSMGKAIERLLTVGGYNVRTFSSGAELRTQAKLDEAICLIIDINLNGESAIDLKEQVSRSHPELPVIFMTGNGSEANSQAVRRVGAVAYLRKPFGSRLLLDAIEAAARVRCGRDCGCVPPGGVPCA
jgi:FixJ family two-component response regulator